jgi:hypothetical protein
MPEIISQAEFARRKGVSRTAVTKAVQSGRIERAPKGIDWITQSEAWERNKAVDKDNVGRMSGTGGGLQQKYNEILATRQYYEAKLKEIKLKEAESGEIPKLAAIKLQKEIALKDEQIARIQLENEIKKKNLVPIELVAIWMGNFANGLRTYFFPIGKRVSPNDKKIQRKYEKELSKAIEKTLSETERALRKESEKVAESVNG